jgi:hypothetical protein
MNFNEWAQQLNVGTRYERPIPPPNCHYFDTKVFKQSLTKNKNKSIMRTLKKLFGLAVIITMTASMTSCAGYTVLSNGKGCGMKMPKKFSGKAPRMRSNAHMVTF